MQIQDQELIMIKGKRSKRARPASPLALTMATSSSEFSYSSDRVATSSGEFTNFTSNEFEDEEEDMAKCLILLAKGSSSLSISPTPLVALAPHDHDHHHRKPASTSTAEIYQCKTCNKSFHSFQALGGHRASHKKPNKPPVSPQEEKMVKLVTTSDNTTLSLKVTSSSNGVSSGCGVQNKSRVHECSICGAEFASGQALGGHMRRHRPIPAASTAGQGGECQETKRPRTVLSLDLNMPAPEDESSSKFPFASKEQVIVFSATSLVDCQF